MKQTTKEAPSVLSAFDLKGKVAIITGGAGFLGMQHAAAIAEANGMPVLLDVNASVLKTAQTQLRKGHLESSIVTADITKKAELTGALEEITKRHGRLDILINNAGIDPKVSKNGSPMELTRFENMTLEQWNLEVEVGLTGAFLASQVFGSYMAGHGGGVILNISSDLALIGPDQRIYRKPGLPEDRQPVKPVTYSVVKTGLIGLTRYLATYWADKNVRVNAVSPGGASNNQPEDFVQRLSSLIPLGRMARPDEYKAAVVFLISDASSYMTGANLVLDGGRSCW